MRYLTAALCDAYFLLVGILPDGDLNIQFVRCSELGTAFGIKYLMKEIAETLE
jgi:hypothetical protein